jgi:hypothetical protein
MKSSRLIISILLASFVLFTQALAQTGAARVTVPFKFTVANQTLPAGDYQLAVNGSVLQVKSINGSGAAHAMRMYTGGGPNQDLTPRLVFHRYGERHFLAEVWIGEVNMGHQLFVSAGELEYARTTKQETETVAVGVRFIEQGSEPDPQAKKKRAQMVARALRKLGYEVAITPINQVTATNEI